MTVFGRLQESTVDDIQAYTGAIDHGVLHMKRFYCAVFPGDDLSQVLDEDGRLYDVVGEPKHHHGSRRTRRDSVMLRQVAVVRGDNSSG